MHKINRPKFEFKYRGRRRGTAPKHKRRPSLVMKLTCELDPLDFFQFDDYR